MDVHGTHIRLRSRKKYRELDSVFILMIKKLNCSLRATKGRSLLLKADKIGFWSIARVS